MFWAVFMCLSSYYGIGCAGRVSQGIGTQPASAVFHLGQLKNQSLRNLVFFDTVIFGNDHPRYVKHVLGRIYLFVILFWYWVRGAGVPRDCYTTCFCGFSPGAAQKLKFSKLIFLIPSSSEMTIQGM